MDNHKAIVVLSGGQDSTTCLFLAVARGFNVHAVTFNYGQRHFGEIESAMKVAQLAGVPRDQHEIINVGPILKGTSPLISGEKLEQYKDHKSLPGGLEKTFVPMRNQLFLTIAANRAIVTDARTLFTGVCEEDYGGYPDCRGSFIKMLEETINEGSRTKGDDPFVLIDTPLMHRTKSQTVELAVSLKGCYEALAWTHTSYDGKYPPTGHDHATLLRAKGFEEAGYPDPLILRAYHDGLMNLPETDNYSEEACARYPLRFEGSPVDFVGRF